MKGASTRKAFLTGLAALLPTALTILLLVKLYELFASTVGRAFTYVLRAALDFLWPALSESVPDGVLVVAGIILALAGVFFLGLVLASYIGRKIWGFFEGRLLQMPVIRLIYPPLKQITEFIFADRKYDFRRVVVVEYPRKGMWSMGFVTGRPFKVVAENSHRQMVTVFIPSSPTPITGYCVQVARDELMELNLTVDAALRYAVSGGVILPDSEDGHPSAGLFDEEADAESAALEDGGNAIENAGTQE